MKASARLLVPMLVIGAMLLAACGGGGTNATSTTAPGGGTGMTSEPTTAVEPTEEATEAVTAEATEGGAGTGTGTPSGGTGTETAGTGTGTPAAGGGGAPSGEIDCMGAQQGDTVSMLYQWATTEEEQLRSILQPLEEECGITINAETTRDQALLDTRVQAGTPPDIAFWNVTQLQQYQDDLVPVTELGVNEGNLPEFWREIGTVGDQWLGMPVKADPKSIIWYSPANFEALGYEVPTTWEELDALVEQMVADGQVPWSMGLESEAATGWTGSDFIQDILLVNEGPDFVNGIIDGSVSYDDPAVAQAYETYGKWAKDPKYTVGGAQGTLSTGFRDAIFAVFQDPPEAMMVKQSGFAGAEIQAQFPELEYGTDYDFFLIPDIQGLQGGSDWMMAFSDAPAVQAVFAYLSSERGGQEWAAAGFGITPNTAGADFYENPVLQKLSQMLSEAETLVPDIGDSIPGGFNNAEWKAIVDYINGADLQTALTQAAQVQAQAVPAQ